MLDQKLLHVLLGGLRHIHGHLVRRNGLNWTTQILTLSFLLLLGPHVVRPNLAGCWLVLPTGSRLSLGNIELVHEVDPGLIVPCCLRARAVLLGGNCLQDGLTASFT